MYELKNNKKAGKSASSKRLMLMVAAIFFVLLGLALIYRPKNNSKDSSKKPQDVSFSEVFKNINTDKLKDVTKASELSLKEDSVTRTETSLYIQNACNLIVEGDATVKGYVNVIVQEFKDSSFPPSIAFKAAQMQDETKAIVFLRILREMVFLEKKNITKWEHMKTAAEKSDLDVDVLKNNYENDAEKLFRADLNLAAKMGVRGFPSVFIMNEEGGQEFVYGFKPYSLYENAIAKIFPKIKKATYEKTWNFLFSKYPTLTTREFAELMELSIQEGESQLEKLNVEEKIVKFDTKNGPLWKVI